MDLIELAKECGAGCAIDADDGTRLTDFSSDQLTVFAAHIRADEREECAKACEARMPLLDAAARQLDDDEALAKCCVTGRKQQVTDCASAIRSRK